MIRVSPRSWEPFTVMSRHADMTISSIAAMGVVNGWLSGVLDSDTSPE